MPQPQIWNGQDARRRGLLFIKILLEVTDVDMLEDEYRLKVFPFLRPNELECVLSPSRPREFEVDRDTEFVLSIILEL